MFTSAKKKLLISGVAIIAALGVTSLLMPGCFGRECDGDEASWGPPPDVYAANVDAGLDAAVIDTRMLQGQLIDENTWESNAMTGDWLTYLHERAWHLYYPQLGNRQPDQITAYISAVINPNATGDTQTAGGGNVAKFIGVQPNVATVKNDTCADFYLRVVVHVPPYTDAGSVQDASNDSGTSSDSGIGDAAKD